MKRKCVNGCTGHGLTDVTIMMRTNPRSPPRRPHASA